MTTLVSAEIRKVLTLRYWWALALTPVVVALLAAAFTRSVVDAVADSTVISAAGSVIDVNLASTAIVLGGSITIALLFAALFGAVTVGNEFTYRTFTTTFLTARGRDGVLAAKTGVIAAFAIGYAAATILVAASAMVLFTRDFRFTIDLFAIGGAGIIVCALTAVLGAGVTMLIGSSTRGVLSLLGWCAAGEWILRALLSAAGADRLGASLPLSSAIGTIVNAAPSVELDWFAPWPSAPMILVAWVVVFVGAGWFRMRTRDIT